MSVGSSNLTGIPTQRQAPPVKAPQANQNNQPANQSPRANALANASRPANAPVVPTAPVVAQAVNISGGPTPAGPTATTTGRGIGQANTAPPASQPGTIAQALAMAMSPRLLAAIGAAAFTSNRGKVSRISGDATEESGNVELETESEDQPDALQEADTEQGSGEINAGNQASGPAT